MSQIINKQQDYEPDDKLLYCIDPIQTDIECQEKQPQEV